MPTLNTDAMDNVLFLRKVWTESRNSANFNAYSDAYKALSPLEQAALGPDRSRADHYTARKQAANRANTRASHFLSCCGECGSRFHTTSECR